MTDWGYPGLFAAAFVAGSVLPFSSEATMIALVALGLDPLGCLMVTGAGNTLGGMTCYWIGRQGKREWLERLGIRREQLDRAERFVAGRGAWMALFTFLPTLGEAIAVLLGMMHSNPRITTLAMWLGKSARYGVILALYLFVEQQWL